MSTALPLLCSAGLLLMLYGLLRAYGRARAIRAALKPSAAQAQQLQQQIAALTTVLDANPQQAGAYVERSHLHFALDHYAESLADADRALECDPQHADALMARAAALSKLARYDDSLADADRAIALAPQRPDLYVRRAELHYNLLHMGEAVLDLEQALTLDLRHAPAYLARARIFYNAGLPRRALPDFTAYADLLGEETEGWVHDAITEIEGGARARRIKQDKTFQRKLGNAYLARGDYPRAVEEYTAWIEQRPSAEGFLARGKAYYLLGDDARAIADLDRGADLAPLPELYGYLGLANARQGNESEALERLRDYVYLVKGKGEEGEPQFMAVLRRLEEKSKT